MPIALQSWLRGEKARLATCAGTTRELGWRWEITMSFKTILVPVEQHHLMNSTLRTALLLGRMFDSYIEGFALRFGFPLLSQ